MGYFDAISNAYFKTGQDGRRLFFPWGALGRGNVITPAEETRLRGVIKAYIIAAFVVVAGGYALGREIGALVAGAAVIAIYAAVVGVMMRGHEAARERLALREAYAAEARGFSAKWLWTSLAIMVVLFGIGVAMFITEPDMRLQALGTMAVAVVLVAFLGWMLMLRRGVKSQ